MISVIDYGAGNLRSVENALRRAGADVRVCSDAGDLDSCEKVIFPGVGAFGDVMANLESAGLDKAIKDAIGEGKPFLGICLGQQTLFGGSEENPDVKGLEIFKGKCVKFESKGNGIKVPQIGWNRLEIVKKESKLFQGVKTGSYAYFVHSYYVVPRDREIVSAETEYTKKYASAVEKGKVFAVQFHPEKSGEAGLRMLKNFVEM